MENKDLFLKLDKMSNDIADLRISAAQSVVILDRNSKDIENHIKRTDLLEEKVVILKQSVDGTESKWKGALWAATAIFGAIASLVQILGRVLIK